MAFAILYTCILQFNVKRLNRGIKYLCKIKNLQYMPWIINIFVNVENTIKCLSSIFQDPSKKVEYIPCMNDIRVSNSFFLCIKMFKWIYVGSKILIGVGRSQSTQREPGQCPSRLPPNLSHTTTVDHGDGQCTRLSPLRPAFIYISMIDSGWM